MISLLQNHPIHHIKPILRRINYPNTAIFEAFHSQVPIIIDVNDFIRTALDINYLIRMTPKFFIIFLKIRQIKVLPVIF